MQTRAKGQGRRRWTCRRRLAVMGESVCECESEEEWIRSGREMTEEGIEQEQIDGNQKKSVFAEHRQERGKASERVVAQTLQSCAFP